MLERVFVPLPGRQYESIVEYQSLPRTGELVRKVLPPNQCAVITDSNVGPLYADVVTASLDQAGFKPTVIAVPGAADFGGASTERTVRSARGTALAKAAAASVRTPSTLSAVIQ